MTKPAEKLAAALAELKDLQDKNIVAIRARNLSKLAKKRLIASGFLKEVIKGWYLPYFPTTPDGETTIWYANFWDFCAQFCREKFGNAWCLSPEQSLLIHAGNWSVPKQLLIHSPKGSNKVTKLLFDTSIFEVRNKMPPPAELATKNGLNIFSLESALIHSSAKFFAKHPTDARTVLACIRDTGALLKNLLAGDHSVIAGRLSGAFRNVNLIQQADSIVNTMRQLSYEIREIDPFDDNISLNISNQRQSPYALRLQIMWTEMRAYIIKIFPKAKKISSVNDYLHDVDEKYVEDAYHSLSIEGYKVTAELIEKVSRGKWDPSKYAEDRNDLNAMAAYGYSLAFKQVKKSIRKVLRGENAGAVVRQDHKMWYTHMFQPSVTAGILQPYHLAGYRDHQVYIKGSHHVPPSKDAIMDMLEIFFDLLEQETEASVRIVLGHFVFVFIHPYMDGNGRIGRFLMNVMCAAGGYPWTIVPVERRVEYMRALEAASVKQDIEPFCNFLASLLR